MKKIRVAFIAVTILANIIFAAPKIYIAFLWHMHQPIYYPGEDVVQTHNAGHYSYNLFDVFNSRYGPYTSWPKNAVTAAANNGLGYAGAQVSFSGTLVKNLNRLENNGNGNFTNWKSHWNTAKGLSTSGSNPRLDMVAFGEYHPLMPLISHESIVRQIRMHKATFAGNFNGNYSKGMFPPENAFANHMIPALVDEGIEWVLVDNIHFDRTCENYPYSTSGNLYEPNRADVVNADPNDWKQLNNLWAPTQVSAAWGHRPHYAEYIDPVSGQSEKIIVVPTSRYLGNEDGRGGYGALLYETVMSQLESYNTDADHPILIVLHHDGDNYGGGTDSYYGSNFNSFISWVKSKSSRFECTTIQDYLDRFPPATDDIIHVEPGSWAGADNGDPQFRKWLGNPGSDGYSPDRNSWGVITAADNLVRTAEQMMPVNPAVGTAWNWYAMAQTSCYWYWDGSEGGLWDSHPTRASNMAMDAVEDILSTGSDMTEPSIFLPQRDPYNPGGTEFTVQQNSDMKVWTYVYDRSGLTRVELKYRIDADGVNDMSTTVNETYTGGTGVGAWQTTTMTGVSIPAQTNPMPNTKAKEYSAEITGQSDVLIDYYVEAEDFQGNIAKSPIQHVWIGQSYSGGGGGDGISWLPTNPTKDDTITFTIDGIGQGATLHWGVNDWTAPNPVYRPAGSTMWSDGKACRTSMDGPENNTLTAKIGPFNDPAQVVSEINFVINYNDGTWDNNNGNDYRITISEENAIAGSIHNFLAFPNPGRSMLTLQYENAFNSEMEINIYDLAGRRVYNSKAHGNQKNINIGHFAAGMYIVTLQDQGSKDKIKMKYIKL